MRARCPYIIAVLHELVSLRSRHLRAKLIASEEVLHQRVEASGIFQEAAMAGARQNPMFGMRDQGRGPLAARQGAVVLAVYDQCRATVGGKLWREVGNGQRLKHLRNAFGVERAAPLDKSRQQITPYRRVRPRLRNAMAKMA